MCNSLSAANAQSGKTPLDPQTILIFAIAELDVLISELISSGKVSISPQFHDWVADSLTKTVETKLLLAQQTQQFQTSLRIGNARTVLAHWVWSWTCREIEHQFAEYVQFCPCRNPSAMPCTGRPAECSGN